LKLYLLDQGTKTNLKGSFWKIGKQLNFAGAWTSMVARNVTPMGAGSFDRR
jgi:hypothetical protein